MPSRLYGLMWSSSPWTVVAHSRCNTYLTRKIFRTVIPSGSSCQTHMFTFQLCFLTADVADNHRCVGNCCESRKADAGNSLQLHMTCIGCWKQKVPTCICQQNYQSLSGGIYTFWCTSGNLGRNSLKMKCYRISLWVGVERHQSCFQFQGQPRKRQPWTEVPLCLNTGDPQIDSAASRAVLS